MVRILLVEDNELNRDMLSRRLMRKGFEVRVAPNGAEAIESVAVFEPELILMDLNMPVMDGWEASKLLKANPKTASIPIIALTAHAMAGDREKILAADFDSYASKPVDLAKLLAEIQKILL